MKTLFTLILLVSGISQIYCQDSVQIKKAPWFVQRFKVSAGLFIPVNNTNIEIDPSDGTGTDIDFEDDLGFEEVTPTLLADFQWRTSRRSRLDFSFYLVNRKSTKTLDKDIIFGEDTFKVNSSVSSSFNTDIYRISYGYALLSKPKFEAGLLVGVHVVGAKAGISFKGDNLNIAASSDYRITAPLPDFGIWGGYEFNKRFAVNAEAGYLGLSVNEIKGRILAYSAIVSYRIIDPLHVAIGFTGLNFAIDAERERLDGDLKWSNNGATITVTYAFGKKNWLTN
jgi:hypothetical protein